MSRRFFLVLLVVAAITPAAAFASRAPTSRERAAIVRIERAEMSPQQRSCAVVRVRVSTANPHFAFATWTFKGACRQYAGNGADIVRERHGRWRRIFSGDFAVAPPCRKVPDRVSVDLWNGEHCRS